MTDAELDRLVARTMSVTDVEVESWNLESGEANLLEEIMSIESRNTTRRRHHVLLAIAVVAAALVVAFAIPVISDGGAPAYATELVAVAEANERLLITAEGWKVTRADEFSVTDGEVTFSNGASTVDLYWYQASYAATLLPVLKAESPFEEVSFVGKQATLFSDLDDPEYFKLYIEPNGLTFTEIRGRDISKDEFLSVLNSFAQVSVNDWLAALPESVVTPSERAKTVRAILADIPLPEGFDTDELLNKNTTKDRYQLVAEVTGAAACSWLDQFFTADETGNQVAKTEAQAALSTSFKWKALIDIDPEGYWSEAIWQAANATNGGGVMTGGGEVPITRGLMTGGLGCKFSK